MRPVSRSRRGPVIAAVAAGLLVTGLPTVSSPVSSTPATDSSSAATAIGESAESRLRRSALRPHTVTLITGDVVSYAKHGSSYDVEIVRPRRHVAGTVPPSYLTQVGPDGAYVIPTDAWPLIQADRLDRELFNLTYLVENGYADRSHLPVIVQYPRRLEAAEVRTKAQALDHSTATATLASIDAAAVDIPMSGTGSFWADLLADTAATRLAHGVQKIWLDGQLSLALDESVPLIGAPTAWAAGYDGTGVDVAVLDGGIDETHPDFDGRIAASRSFVTGPPTDGYGHGTHVASTIAGSGAASDGQYEGVAPGASLLIGKVCSDNGQCPWSAVIEGMEWAAVEQGADVVSISLGGCCSDGTDPASQAVDQLTAATGTLFVIAAGNDGPDRETIAAPAAADSALTVAATDKSDGLADFSSRGPRPVDLALKPEIAAPGVAIAAARSSGTSMGTPVDDFYTAASGTSMATPHVSGAAAILAQAHPDWEAPQLKAALMSTATDVGRSVYEVGAGRLDVGRAITQQVFASTAKLDFGINELPGDGEPVPEPTTKTLSYLNTSDQPVTLALTPRLTDADGAPIDPGVVSVPASVEVPANGTASVDVALARGALERGEYGGTVTAENADENVLLTTPVGIVMEPRRFTLTVRTIGPDGEPATPSAQDTIDVTGPGGRVGEASLVAEGVTRIRVPAGTYSVAQVLAWIDDDSRLSNALLSDPEVEVEADTEIVLDARDAHRIGFDTPKPAGPVNSWPTMAYQRTNVDGERFAGTIVSRWTPGAWARFLASPTDEVTQGSFRFWTQTMLGQPEVAMTTVGPGRDDTLPVVMSTHHGMVVGDGSSGAQQLGQDFHPDWRPFTGTELRRLVDIGRGTPEDLEGLDLDGRLALLESADAFDGPFGRLCGIDVDRLRMIGDAGAAGVVAFPSPDHPCGQMSIPMQAVQEPFSGPARSVGIPNAYLSTRAGVALQQRLADGPVTLRVAGTPETPYSYVLKTYEEGHIPADLHYEITDRMLGQTRLDYHAPGHTTFYEHRMVWKPDDIVREAMTLGPAAAPSFTGPKHRTEYFGPISDEILQSRSSYARQGGLAAEGYVHRIQRGGFTHTFEPGASRETWYGAPVAPGADPGSDAIRALGELDPSTVVGNCSWCRQGEYFIAFFPMVTGGADNLQSGGYAGLESGQWVEEGYWDLDMRLTLDGEEPERLAAPWPIYLLPDEAARYELTAVGSRTDATWTFSSERPTADTRRSGYDCVPETLQLSQDPCAPQPMVFASYDLTDSLDTDNTVDARLHRFEVFGYHADSTARMPTIDGLEVWTRVGDGDWRRAGVRAGRPDRHGNRTFDVVAHYPRPRGDATVDLRLEAWDAAGNRLEQTTREAFTLTR